MVREVSGNRRTQVTDSRKQEEEDPEAVATAPVGLRRNFVVETAKTGQRLVGPFLDMSRLTEASEAHERSGENFCLPSERRAQPNLSFNTCEKKL